MNRTSSSCLNIYRNFHFLPSDRGANLFLIAEKIDVGNENSSIWFYHQNSWGIKLPRRWWWLSLNCHLLNGNFIFLWFVENQQQLKVFKEFFNPQFPNPPQFLFFALRTNWQNQIFIHWGTTKSLQGFSLIDNSKSVFLFALLTFNRKNHDNSKIQDFPFPMTIMVLSIFWLNSRVCGNLEARTKKKKKNFHIFHNYFNGTGNDGSGMGCGRNNFF